MIYVVTIIICITVLICTAMITDTLDKIAKANR